MEFPSRNPELMTQLWVLRESSSECKWRGSCLSQASVPEAEELRAEWHRIWNFYSSTCSHWDQQAPNTGSSIAHSRAGAQRTRDGLLARQTWEETWDALGEGVACSLNKERPVQEGFQLAAQCLWHMSGGSQAVCLRIVQGYTEPALPITPTLFMNSNILVFFFNHKSNMYLILENL